MDCCKRKISRCLRDVLSKLLAARKANFLYLLVLSKKRQCSHAHECSQRPFVTPRKDIEQLPIFFFSATDRNAKRVIYPRSAQA